MGMSWLVAVFIALLIALAGLFVAWCLSLFKRPADTLSWPGIFEVRGGTEEGDADDLF
jgi:hypothetical protein